MTTLPDLFREMDVHPEAVPLEELVARLRGVDLARHDVDHVVRFKDDRYARNVLHLGPGYAALILCWKPGQRSPIHDHRGSACGVRVIQGTCTETVFTRQADGMLREGDTRTLATGGVCGSYDTDIHELRNDDPAVPLITLHVYTPALDTFHVYSRASTEVKSVRDRETAEARQRAAMA